MAQNHLSLSWQLHQENMRTAFSLSQQNGDFVDLTLAADGHLVKVHQLILGVASPYIKNLIQSAKCNHPVIFLNNVSYTTLCSLLEYVYTGEVAIAEENLQPFLSIAKALRIQGLDVDASTAEDIDDTIDNTDSIDDAKDDTQSVQIQVINDEANLIPLEEKETPTKTISSNFDKSQYGIKRKADKQNDSFSPPLNKTSKQIEDIDDTSQKLDIIDETTKESLIIGYANQKFELAPVSDLSVDNYANSQELQYTVSSRGSLQLILNRFMYNLFSKSNGGQIRRWRCVDYRDHKCPACAVTNGNVVVKRTNMHIHPFHDKKILAKIQKKAIFSAIKTIDPKIDAEM